ncbi:hypothetical protein CFP56_017166 [Quercus suber]|uniref:Uncharacterized protein n=1 Tax=Quercus suber TaxID=58331 RepID=A0AAW0KMU5_QUESU
MQNSDKKACFSRPASASVSTATAEPINSQKSYHQSRRKDTTLILQWKLESEAALKWNFSISMNLSLGSLYGCFAFHLYTNGE